MPSMPFFFAPTMSWFKFRNLVPDRLIPSTMLAGHTLPAMTQALIFLVLLGVFVVCSAMVLAFNLITDLVYRSVDPRIEFAT